MFSFCIYLIVLSVYGYGSRTPFNTIIRTNSTIVWTAGFVGILKEESIFGLFWISAFYWFGGVSMHRQAWRTRCMITLYSLSIHNIHVIVQTMQRPKCCDLRLSTRFDDLGFPRYSVISRENNPVTKFSWEKCHWCKAWNEWIIFRPHY